VRTSLGKLPSPSVTFTPKVVASLFPKLANIIPLHHKNQIVDMPSNQIGRYKRKGYE
jgi:hypothetical protein